MHFHKLTAVLALFFLSLSLYVGTGHAQSGSCIAAVERAMEIIGDSCGDLDRNNACYGNNAIDAAFFDEEIPDDLFTVSGDVAPIDEFRYIETSPLNQTLDEWGVAVMRLQANLPATLPGQATVFVLFGETQVAEASEQDEIFVQDETVITLEAPMRDLLRDIPSPSARVVRPVPTGTELQIDAQSEDGEWLRAIIGEDVGWVRKALFEGNEDALSALSVLDLDETFTPMQSFYFSTGVGGTECTETPNLLFVQGPEDVTVNLRANGVDIQLGSTLALRTLGGPPRIQLIAVEGDVFTDPFSGTPVRIPPLTYTEAPITTTVGPDGTIITTIAGPWSAPLPITDEIKEVIAVISLIPDNILNYPIQLPPDIQIITTPPEVPVFVPPVIVQQPPPEQTPEVQPPPVETQEPVAPPPPEDDGGNDDDGGGDATTTTGADPFASSGGNVTLTTDGFIILDVITGNAGTQTVTNVVTSVDLSALPVIFDGFSPSQGTFDSGTGVWTVGDIPAGGSATLSIGISSDGTTGTFPVNVAVVSASSTDINTSNNTHVFNVTVIPPSADIVTNVTASPANPNEGDTVTLTTTVTNNGPSDAVNVTTTDNFTSLPLTALTTFPAPSQGFYDPAMGIWDIGTLASGSSATVSIQYTVNAGAGGTSFNATANTTTITDDPAPGNNGASATITVNLPSTDMSITVTVVNATVFEGGIVDFFVEVTNNGTVDAPNVQVSNNANTLPLTFSSSEGSAGTYNSGTGIWDIGTIAAGATEDRSIQFSVNNGTAGNSYTATFNISNIGIADPNLANNSANGTFTVATIPTILSVDTAAMGINSILFDGLCSFAEAIQALNTDTTVSDCVAGAATTTISLDAAGPYAAVTGDFNDGLDFALPPITSPIIINANGQTISRTGGGQFSLLRVSAGGSLTLNGATLTGGDNTISPAIDAAGNGLTLNNTVVTGNTGFAAIYIGGGTGSFNGVTISNNTSTGLVVDGVGTMTITNSNFTNNGLGGLWNRSSTIAFNGGTFDGNTDNPINPGAALQNDATIANATTTFDGTTFLNNAGTASIASANAAGGFTSTVNFANVVLGINNTVPNCLDSGGGGTINFVDNGGNNGANGDMTCFP